jgi:hypothetical protein
MKVFSSTSFRNLVWGFTGGYSLSPIDLKAIEFALGRENVNGEVVEILPFITSHQIDPELRRIFEDTDTFLPMFLDDSVLRATANEYGIDMQESIDVYKIRVVEINNYAREHPRLNLPVF